ncbi:MAG TPA: PKD domain-containing protein [Bacteroidia bacterium]
MCKKIILVSVFLIVSVFSKAQITQVQYPSGPLSEEKITQILEESRKRGTKDWELQKHSEMLHKLLKQQEEAIKNGTYNANPVNQKTTQPNQVMQACTNPGFEDGTTNGWVLNKGYDASPNPCPTCITPGGSGGLYQVVMAATTSTVNTVGGCSCAAVDCAQEPAHGTGFDYFGGFPVVAPAPLGGTHSLLLNHSMCGNQMEQAIQSFVVNPANVSFTFQYAVVLQDGSHPLADAPYFIVNVTDVATGTVVPCTQYSASAVGATSGALNGWTVSTIDASVYWYPWTTVTLDLTSMLGRTVAIAFTVSDCTQGGHFGYAYIDASCNPLQITLTQGLCAGGAPAILTGPPGMASYAWTGPVTAATQSLTTSTPGNYTLTTTLASGCPAPMLYYNLTMSPQPVPNFVSSNPPCSGSMTFTDGSTVPTGTITNWVWNYGDGSPLVNSTTAANQTHAYSPPGAYTVTLTDTTDQHCVASYSFVVNAGGGGPNPAFSSNSPATAPQCLLGNNVVFTNASTTTGSVTIEGYIWDFGDGSPIATSTTVTPNTSHSYTASGTYVVTLTVNVVGCNSTITQTVVINPMPTATISAPPVCVGNTTVFTSTITNGSTYNWDYGDPVGTGVAGTATPTHSYALANTYAVTLTVTSAGGCTVTTTTNVIVSPVPTATFTVAQVCEGTASFINGSASTPSVGATYNWTFGGAGVGTNTITSTPSYIYASAGTFPITLLVTVGTCSATAAGSAVVDPMPVLSITTTPACDQSAVTITNTTPAQGTFTVWAWTMGDGIGTCAVAAPGSYTYPAAGIYTVTLIASTATGCSGTVTTTAIVHPNPVAGGSIDFVCLNSASTFSSTSTVSNPPGINDAITSWNWTFGDGGSSPTPSPTHTYAACGSYTVGLTVATSFNCTNTISGTDTVYCLPVATAPPSFSICPGTLVTSAQTTFSTTCALPMIAPPATIYFTNNPNPNNNTSTTHGGIPLADTVGFNSIPNYPAIAQNLTCGLLIDTIYGVAITPVSPTNAGCIGNVATFTISVYPTPTVTPIASVSVCANQTVNLPPFSGCPTPETFSWTTTTNPNTVNTGIAAIGSGNIAPFVGTNNTDAVAITGVDVTPWAHGCIGIPTSFSITINPIPSMTVSSYTFCPGDNVPSPAIVSDPLTGVVYTWTVNNNTGIGMAVSGTGIPTAYTAPANSTLTNQIGGITYIPTSTNGCVGTATTETINIKPTPYMQPVADQYWCPYQMTNAVTFATLPPSANSTYAWTYNSGGVPTPGATSVFPSLGPTSNGGLTTIPIVVNVIPTLNGCPGPDSAFIIHVYPKPQANFTYNTVCFGTPTTFTNTSLPNVGTNAVVSWNWNFGNGQSSTNQNPPYIFLSAGSQTVSLIVATHPSPSLSNGGLGCPDTITKYPFVNPIPVANFSADSVGCPSLSTQFHDISSVTLGETIQSYTWTFGNGNSSNSQIPNLQTYNNTSPTQPMYYNVSLTVKSDSGCTNTKTKNNFIEVYPRPIADFSWGPTTANIDDPTVIFYNEAVGYSPHTNPIIYGTNTMNTGVQYYLGDVFTANASSNNVYTNLSFSHTYSYERPYTYYATQWVINSYGCTDSITKPVEILPDFTFYIPNAFSPNGDGKNDGFKGLGMGIDANTYNMWIFDRWGLMIYYTTDLNQSWDGHMHGDEGKPVLQEDVYVWKVKFSDIFGTLHEYHGTVTLLK